MTEQGMYRRNTDKLGLWAKRQDDKERHARMEEGRGCDSEERVSRRRPEELWKQFGQSLGSLTSTELMMISEHLIFKIRLEFFLLFFFAWCSLRNCRRGAGKGFGVEIR